MTKNQQTLVDFANHHWAQCGSETRIRVLDRHCLQLECVACHHAIKATFKSAREGADLFVAVSENYLLLSLDATVQ